MLGISFMLQSYIVIYKLNIDGKPIWWQHERASNFISYIFSIYEHIQILLLVFYICRKRISSYMLRMYVIIADHLRGNIYGIFNLDIGAYMSYITFLYRTSRYRSPSSGSQSDLIRIEA